MAAELEAKHPNSKVSNSVGQFTNTLESKHEINGEKNSAKIRK